MTDDKPNWPTEAEVRASFPPPRYRLVGYDIGTAPDENGGWVHWTDHEAIVARLTAERDAAIFAVEITEAAAFSAGYEAGADARQADLAARYRLVGYDIGTAPDENGGWVHWTDHEAIVARLTAERMPVWLIAYLESAASRLPGLQHDLAAWRDLAADAPAHLNVLTPPADLAAKIGGE